MFSCIRSLPERGQKVESFYSHYCRQRFIFTLLFFSVVNGVIEWIDIVFECNYPDHCPFDSISFEDTSPRIPECIDTFLGQNSFVRGCSDEAVREPRPPTVSDDSLGSIGQEPLVRRPHRPVRWAGDNTRRISRPSCLLIFERNPTKVFIAVDKAKQLLVVLIYRFRCHPAMIWR